MEESFLCSHCAGEGAICTGLADGAYVTSGPYDYEMCWFCGGEGFVVLPTKSKALLPEIDWFPREDYSTEVGEFDIWEEK